MAAETAYLQAVYRRQVAFQTWDRQLTLNFSSGAGSWVSRLSALLPEHRGNPVSLIGMDDVLALRGLQREFVREREWEQFHTPKNVAMALGGEVGELAEAILPFESRYPLDRFADRSDVSDEIGDVTLYLLRLHDLLDVPVAIGADAIGESPRRPEPAMLVSAMFKLMASVGRILESYQWTSGAEPLSTDAHQQAAARLAAASRDLVAVSKLLAINPISAATAKLEKNRLKYPVESSRGTSRKYTEIWGE